MLEKKIFKWHTYFSFDNSFLRKFVSLM
jgi:hypothetical protein